MDPRRRLASTCQAESKAYGYTLSIWGAGALLVHQFGTPTPLSVFAYVGGGILGFALITAVAFGSPLSDTDVDTNSEFVAAATVHVVATPGNLALSYGLVSSLATLSIDSTVVFGLVGVQATVTYNVLMLFEDSLSLVLGSVVNVEQ